MKKILIFFPLLLFSNDIVEDFVSGKETIPKQEKNLKIKESTFNKVIKLLTKKNKSEQKKGSQEEILSKKMYRIQKLLLPIPVSFIKIGTIQKTYAEFYDVELENFSFLDLEGEKDSLSLKKIIKDYTTYENKGGKKIPRVNGRVDFEKKGSWASTPKQKEEINVSPEVKNKFKYEKKVIEISIGDVFYNWEVIEITDKYIVYENKDTSEKTKKYFEKKISKEEKVLKKFIKDKK